MRVGALRRREHGLTEIEAAYDGLLHHTMPGATVKMERGSIRMLTPEFAVRQGGIEIFPSNGGSSLKGHAVQVMKKVEGRWLILEGPKIPPPAR